MKIKLVLLALYGFKDRGWLFSTLARGVLKSMEKIYVEGENGANDLKPLAIDMGKIVKFQHWVDQGVFNNKNREESEDLRVLFVGRPIPEKGCAIVKRCDIVLKGKVRFEYAKDVPYEKLSAYYKRADVLVVPSIYPEGFVRVVAEASSCGCAVITSDQGSLPEMTRGFGIMFDVKDYRTLLVLIKCLDADRNLLSVQKKLAYEYAVKNFSEANAQVFMN